MKKILVVAPHADDETLGCGGTILKHLSQGDQVHWLLVTNISNSVGWSDQQVERRQIEIKKIKNMYGFHSLFMLDFGAAKLDSLIFSEIIKKINTVISELKPQVIYLNSRNDIHTDHQITFKAVMSCTKSFRHQYIKRILMYETLSETEYSPPFPENQFAPNVYIDISNYFDKKCLIMSEYKSEIMEKPLPRSISTLEALAKYRGSRIGVEYAEAFQLLYEKL